MRKVRVAPKGMGIHEFAAQEQGFFRGGCPRPPPGTTCGPIYGRSSAPKGSWTRIWCATVSTRCCSRSSAGGLDDHLKERSFEKPTYRLRQAVRVRRRAAR
jgi:hypothetical protein